MAQKKYQQKNKNYIIDNNESADKVLCMMEHSVCISETLKNDVIGIVLWILSNHEKYVEEIRESIAKLRTELEWVSIFSDTFVSRLCFNLGNALNEQIYQTELKKKEEKKKSKK